MIIRITAAFPSLNEFSFKISNKFYKSRRNFNAELFLLFLNIKNNNKLSV